MRGSKYRPTIEPPYRWRDWAAQDNGVTGPVLIAFINQGGATRPDGTKGLGLLAYLSGLHKGPTSRKRVIVLREMRDAAGDSGEFYTPHPVVRFMVEALNPRLKCSGPMETIWYYEQPLRDWGIIGNS